MKNVWGEWKQTKQTSSDRIEFADHLFCFPPYIALDNSDNSPGSLYQLAQQFLNSIVNYELYLNFYEYKSVLNIISRGRMACAMINGNGSLGRNNFRRRRRWRFFSIQIIKFSDNRTVGERQSWEEASQKFPTLTLDAISAERPANENIS